MKIKFNIFFIIFLIIAAVTGFQIETLVIFVSVLCHELGHVAAAKLLKVRVEEVELLPIGGVARMEDITKLGGYKEAIIATAGPAVSGFFWFLSVQLLDKNPLFAVSLKYNMALTLFNMVPALPMDGGRIGRNLIMGFVSYKGATAIMSGIGQAIAMSLGIYNIYLLVQGSKSAAYIVTAIFIFAGTLKEKKYTSYIYLLHVNDKKQQKIKKGTIRVRTVDVGEETTLISLAKIFSPLYVCEVQIHDKRDNIIAVLEEADVMDGIMRFGYDARVKDLL